MPVIFSGLQIPCRNLDITILYNSLRLVSTIGILNSDLCRCIHQYFLFLIGSFGKVEMRLYYHELSVDAVINAVVGTVISVIWKSSLTTILKRGTRNFAELLTAILKGRTRKTLWKGYPRRCTSRHFLTLMNSSQVYFGEFSIQVN